MGVQDVLLEIDNFHSNVHTNRGIGLNPLHDLTTSPRGTKHFSYKAGIIVSPKEKTQFLKIFFHLISFV